MRVNILDARLRSISGHNFDDDLRIARTLAGQGHDVELVAHVDASDDIAPLVPKGVGYRKLLRVDPEGNKAWRLPRRVSQLPFYYHAARRTAADLRSIRQADLWIWPTLFAFELRASAISGLGVPVSGVIHDPLEHPGPQALGATEWRDAVRQVKHAGIEIRRIGTIEDELTRQLAPILGDLGLRTLALPHQATLPVERRAALKTIGFFGHQGHWKGAELIEEIAGVCAGMGLDVIVHDSAAGNIAPDIGGPIKRYGFVPDLPALMSEADIVVLPYGVGSYVRRCSGIGALALACGIPVLAPAGIALAKHLKEYRTGATYDESSAAAIIAALVEMRAIYAAHADSAFRAAARWAEVNGLERHVAELIGS